MLAKRILWGLGALALLAIVAWVGFALWQRNAQLDPSTYSLRVNGEAASPSALEEANQRLLQSYRETYLQRGGGDFEQFLSGPAGAYNQLQVKYQAAQELIEDALIRQEVRRRGLDVRSDELEKAFQERYQHFLEVNTMTEDDLQGLLRDPAKKVLTQRLLGLRDESVDALKDRVRRETQQNLLKTKLAEAVLGQGVLLTSDAGKERWNKWLDEFKAQSTIVFSDPLLNAYHLRQRADQGKTLEERLRYLDEAIAAYEQIKAKDLSSDPNLSYYLAQLYVVRVNWSLQLEQDLQQQAQNNQQTQQKLNDVQQQISRNREKATQSFLSIGGENDEKQLQVLMQGDPNNPFYYYLYARFLLTQREDVRRAFAPLKKALELDPKYVDGYVLLGDLNVFREHFSEAIEAYTQALPLAKEMEASGQKFKSANSRPAAIQGKLAEAFLDLARQLKQYPQEGSEEKRTNAISQADELLRGLLQSTKEEDPAYATVLADIGDVEFLKGNYLSAQERYQKSLTHVKDKAVQVKLGRAYLLNKELTAADEVFQGVLQQDPTWATAHLGLAESYLAENRRNDAMQEYKLAFQVSQKLTYAERRQIALDAIQMDPRDAEMHLMLAGFYQEQGVFQGAKDEYQILLKLQPNSVAAYRGLGKASLSRLEYDEALTDLEAALRLSPSADEQVEIYQLVLQVERGVAGPGHPIREAGQNALYQLAALYLNSGELDKSRSALQELSAKYPTYRPNDVAHLVEQLTLVVGDTLPGHPVADQGHRIIIPGEVHPSYNSTPPTSGWHYALPAPWGIHEDPIPDEVQLRNLAGGGVLVQYPPKLAAEVLQQLRTFVAELRKDQKYCQVVLAPYERLDHEIVLTAWDRIDRLAGFDADQIRYFIDAFISQGPEAGEVGCSL